MRSERDLGPIDSFYTFPREDNAGQFCQGTACFVARHLNLERWSAASHQQQRLYCLGSCFTAPASSSEIVHPKIESSCRIPIVLGPLLDGPCRTFAAYSAIGGYQALEQALTRSRAELLESIETSGLRGRGGAGFPTGKKWRLVEEQRGPEKIVIANGDEGDPGAYIDRYLMEDLPHCLIESMAIAGYTIGSTKGYIYLRREYAQACAVMSAALLEARNEGVLGERVFGKSFCFDIELVVGRGSYVCGEETALINSIEGRRPEVRLRPPYPAEDGLLHKPTLINNVETFANIPWIVLHGGAAFRSLGFSSSQGTKVLSLNSLFCSPGLYEVEFGISLREVVEKLGGGLKDGSIIKGLIIGGPLAGIVPPSLFDTSLGFEELARIGAGVGHGGVIAFDERTSIAELLHHVFEFAAFESCGKCTPCRLGSRELEQMFRRVIEAGLASAVERQSLIEITSALEMTSLCGLGTGLADFAKSAGRYYAEELESCFR